MTKTNSSKFAAHQTAAVARSKAKLTPRTPHRAMQSPSLAPQGGCCWRLTCRLSALEQAGNASRIV